MTLRRNPCDKDTNSGSKMLKHWSSMKGMASSGIFGTVFLMSPKASDNLLIKLF